MSQTITDAHVDRNSDNNSKQIGCQKHLRALYSITKSKQDDDSGMHLF